MADTVFAVTNTHSRVESAELAWELYWAPTRAVELTEAISLLAVGVDDTVSAVWDERLRSGAETLGIRLATTS